MQPTVQSLFLRLFSCCHIEFVLIYGRLSSICNVVSATSCLKKKLMVRNGLALKAIQYTMFVLCK